MTRKTLVRLLVLIGIVAVLAAASLILAKNSSGSGVDTPSGWVH